MSLQHVLHSESVSILLFTFGVTTGSTVVFYFLFISRGVARGRALAVEVDDVNSFVSVLRTDSESFICVMIFT